MADFARGSPFWSFPFRNVSKEERTDMGDGVKWQIEKGRPDDNSDRTGNLSASAIAIPKIAGCRSAPKRIERLLRARVVD